MTDNQTNILRQWLTDNQIATDDQIDIACYFARQYQDDFTTLTDLIYRQTALRSVEQLESENFDVSILKDNGIDW